MATCSSRWWLTGSSIWRGSGCWRCSSAPSPGGASRLPAPATVGAGAGLAVVLTLLGTLTWRQAGVYRDGVTLFSHIIALNPEARDAHLNLVGPLSDAGRNEEALAAAHIAVERRSDSPDAHANLVSGARAPGRARGSRGGAPYRPAARASAR